MHKLKIITLIAVALLHILFSWDLSIYHAKLTNEQVFLSISTVITKEDVARENIYDLLNNFNEKIKPTHYLSVALSLPFEPILEPLKGTWISRSALKREIGIEIFQKKITIFDSVQLTMNAIFFSFFSLFLWTLAGKRNNKTPTRSNTGSA